MLSFLEFVFAHPASTLALTNVATVVALFYERARAQALVGQVINPLQKAVAGVHAAVNDVQDTIDAAHHDVLELHNAVTAQAAPVQGIQVIAVPSKAA